MIYVLIYLGIIVVGGPVLLPALYGGVSGVLSLPYVFLAALLANITSDVGWYLVGRYVPLTRLKQSLAFRRPELWEEAERLFVHHKLRIAFISKFIFGTRIVVQILCGHYRASLLHYAALTTLGSLLWLLLLTALTYGVKSGVAQVENTALALQLAFLALLLFYLAVRLLLHRSFLRLLVGKPNVYK